MLLKTHPCRIASLFLDSLALSTACSIYPLVSATRLNDLEMSVAQMPQRAVPLPGQTQPRKTGLSYEIADIQDLNKRYKGYFVDFCEQSA